MQVKGKSILKEFKEDFGAEGFCLQAFDGTEAFFHLTANFNYILMCILSVLIFPSMVIRHNTGRYQMLLVDILKELKPSAAVFPPTGSLADVPLSRLLNKAKAVATGTGFVINKSGQALISLLTLPNSFDPNGSYNYLFQDVKRGTRDQELFRIDYRATIWTVSVMVA